MAPRRPAARRARAPVVQFQFYITTDLTAGFTAVGPRGGFTDGTARHRLKLRCQCGEETDTDVMLYALDSDLGACTDRFGARRVLEACHPRCRNNAGAHLVRKCPCGLRGSVELTAPMASDGAPVLLLDCVGCTPVGYAPGAGWTATTTSGQEIPIQYRAESNIIKVFNKETGDYNVIGTAEFEFVEATM